MMLHQARGALGIQDQSDGEARGGFGCTDGIESQAGAVAEILPRRG